MNIIEFFNFSFLNQSSEAIEIFFRNASFSTLFLSMMFYWIQTAFSSTKKVVPPLVKKMEEALLPFPSLRDRRIPLGQGPQRTQPSGKKNSEEEELGNLAGLEARVLVAVPFSSYSSVGRVLPSKLTNFGTITMILSNILLVCLLIFRWKESGHFPLSNLYESLMFLSWSCTCIHLILDQVVKTAVVRLDATLLTKLIGSITSPSALFTNAFATFSLPPEMQKASPLVPALQSNWLMMHVTVMIISYSALILGSLLSIAFLILISKEAKSSSSYARLDKNLPLVLSPSFTNTDSSLQGSFYYPESEEGGKITNKSGIEIARGTELFKKTKNDLAWNFDNLSYRVLGIGFPFLTIGILSGAVWANEAWGSYWSWDPKETWALLTWLIFAIYLHARITKGWQGKKPAIIASFGFLAIWVCFLGVNLIGEGLHSYGWFSLS